MVITIYWEDTFQLTYDNRKSADINSNFPNPGHNVNDFKSSAIIAVEYQILLRNFKAFKKVNIVKAYSFRLLRIYLVDNLVQSTILTTNKRQHEDDK